MLLEGGPRALTHSNLAQRSGITRQTLYRHWSKPEMLLAQIVTTGPTQVCWQPGVDASAVVYDFLTTMRDRFDDPTTFAVWVAVVGASCSDQTDALARVSETRRSMLNRLLEPSGWHVDQPDFARLIGPLMFQLLHSRQGVDDAFLARTAEAWLRGRSS